MQDTRESMGGMCAKIGQIIVPTVTHIFPNSSLVPSNSDTPTISLRILSLIGVGSFAPVYKCCPEQAPHNLYALKTLAKLNITSQQRSEEEREIALHSIVSAHPGIVTLHAVLEDEAFTYLVLDYCDGDLCDLIHTESLTDAQVTGIVRSILDGLLHCHEQEVYHRDLKPENVLISQGDAKDDQPSVKIADFGLATRQRICRDIGCGTLEYLAPEALDPELPAYDPMTSDIWALGVILVNLRFQGKPWESADPGGGDPYYEAYCRSPRVYLQKRFPLLSEELLGLLLRIFARDPRRRISLRELYDVFVDAGDNGFRLTCDPRNTGPDVEVAKGQEIAPQVGSGTELMSGKCTVSSQKLYREDMMGRRAAATGEDIPTLRPVPPGLGTSRNDMGSTGARSVAPLTPRCIPEMPSGGKSQEADSGLGNSPGTDSPGILPPRASEDHVSLVQRTINALICEVEQETGHRTGCRSGVCSYGVGPV